MILKTEVSDYTPVVVPTQEGQLKLQHATSILCLVYRLTGPAHPQPETIVQSKGPEFQTLLIILLIETGDQHPTKPGRA